MLAGPAHERDADLRIDIDRPPDTRARSRCMAGIGGIHRALAENDLQDAGARLGEFAGSRTRAGSAPGRSTLMPVWPEPNPEWRSSLTIVSTS